MSRERLMPQSLEAEQAILGACLMEREAIAHTVVIVRIDDFYRELHKKIYKVILKLFDRGEPVDIVTVAEELRRAGQLEECGGGDYLVALIEACPSSINASVYAQVVNEKSVLRQLILAAEQISSWAYQPDTDEVHTLVDRALRKVLNISQGQFGDASTHIKPLAMSAYDQIERQFQHRGETSGVPTGFYDLDDITSGLQPSDLIVLAARPSVGKTSLALNIAHHVALKENMPVAIFSLEMSKEQLVQRLVCSQAEIRSQDLRRGRVQDADWHRITNAVDTLYRTPIFINDKPRQTPQEIIASAINLTAEHGQLGLIVVDYLQELNSDEKSENRTQEIGAIVRRLKVMARELKVPVLLISQLSRAVEQREDKRPELPDLRDSGTIGEEADIVMFIYRASYYRRKMLRDGLPDPYAEPDPDEGIAEVIIGKHRNGPVGAIKLGFQPEYARFTNLARGYNGGFDD